MKSIREPTGIAPERIDGRQKVLGEVRFTTDFSWPGMTHAKILRSPVPHARIRSIDASRARALRGVLAVVTGADIATMPDPFYGVGIRDQPVLAIDKVRYVGDMVAAVVAEDEATAFRALELIEVEYAELPALMTIADALSEGAPDIFEGPSPGEALPVGAGAQSLKEPSRNVLYEFRYARGDLESAMRYADHVFTDTFTFSRIHHYHLEPYVNVARADADSIEIWSCNQDPFILRNDLSRMFGFPLHNVRIHTAMIGGGFGAKSYCKMEPLVVFLARQVRRPVRLCLTMDEAFLTLSKHAAILTLKTAVTADGRLIAREADIKLDGGAYSDASVSTTIKTGYRIPGPYKWVAVSTIASAVRTNTVPGGSFRGFGGTQASFASESQIDMIARRLSLDPLEFRRNNMLAPGEPYAPGDSALDSDFKAGLSRVAHLIGYGASPKKRGRGIGLSVGLKDGGGTGNQALAEIKVSDAGEIMIRAAAVEIGQGVGTVLGTIAAEILDRPMTAVRYGEIDTDHTPLDTGTHVSFATAVTGRAIEQAAIDVRNQILEFAAERLDCDHAELVLSDWNILRGNESFPLQKMLRDYYGPVGTEFIGRGRMKIAYDAAAPLGSQNYFWMPCWSAAEVNVDEETGKVTVLKLVVGADAGRAFNLPACHGQLEGAALQAFGQSLFEELIYDGPAPANADPMTYRVPLVTDLPGQFESFIEEQGMGPGPGGAKGLGEAGMLGIAAAIANAVEDAVGARVLQLPITPERVMAALTAQQTAAQPGS
ncbi:xanthine dehydrogenase family protein molybdopterin-binding subunit [Bradyrhizobium sp. WSM1417]|uniref:xanthine dehydrogenase family protein molybdopterin-binding subunit n=1 Tax=Bradyrhizobium sp. WSM1417 TaxID=754500 RepID=UPI0004B4C33F|nr:xanthine dehydrogenase family protein molybdopterin-binding subunit [Bradyrhizobium sp. WSM1417]